MDLNKKIENLIYKINNYISCIDQITPEHAKFGNIDIEVNDETLSAIELRYVLHETMKYFENQYIDNHRRKYYVALDHRAKENILYLIIRWGGALYMNWDYINEKNRG